MCRAIRGLLWAVLACLGLAVLLGVRLDWSPPEPDSDLGAARPPLPPAPSPLPPSDIRTPRPCPVLPIPLAQ
jgi:hypothetical protein